MPHDPSLYHKAKLDMLNEALEKEKHPATIRRLKVRIRICEHELQRIEKMKKSGVKF